MKILQVCIFLFSVGFVQIGLASDFEKVLRAENLLKFIEKEFRSGRLTEEEYKVRFKAVLDRCPGVSELISEIDYQLTTLEIERTASQGTMTDQEMKNFVKNKLQNAPLHHRTVKQEAYIERLKQSLGLINDAGVSHRALNRSCPEFAVHLLASQQNVPQQYEGPQNPKKREKLLLKRNGSVQ